MGSFPSYVELSKISEEKQAAIIHAHVMLQAMRDQQRGKMISTDVNDYLPLGTSTAW